MELTNNEIRVIRRLRDAVAFQTITVKKSKFGKIKRITVHIEEDEILEDEDKGFS